jgi:hypothetical protein
MAFLIGGANSAADTGYDVANSCRFNNDDSPYMHKTPGGAGDNNIWTLSMWIKRGSLSTTQFLFGASTSSSNFESIRINDDDTLSLHRYLTTKQFGWDSVIKLRDPNAWYHLVFSRSGATQKYYINGVERAKTNDDTSTDTGDFNTTDEHRLGHRPDTADGTNHFDGYMAEVYWIDGTIYDADDFGEFNEDSPTIWQPKDASGLTFGTNGFYLDFESSGNLGNDANGGTDLTEVNIAAVDQTTDTPTNNFATLNPLSQGVAATSRTFSEGNTSVSFGGADDSSLSSIGVTAGKWYCEFKVTNEATGYATVGVGNESSAFVTNPGACNIGSSAGAYGYFANGQKRINGAGLADYGDTFTDDDIISIALDLENGAIWFAKNGTWQDSATAGEIAAGTTTNAAATSLSGTFFIGCSNSASGTTGDAFAVNFGNPSYANSSDAADGNGYGAFEYAPPSGYLALCTKNLGSTGG